MQEKNISILEVDNLVFKKISEHDEGIVLDKKFFLDLLKHSLSLGVADKMRVIDAIPDLTQFQFDELIKVFLEEREKFRDLNKEHPEDIKKLLKKQQEEWIEIGISYIKREELEKAKKEAEQKAKEDQAKIDDLKAKLGL